ncbi:thioredoxin domain-containing protein [Candidatus Woesearchaeota archaeon]|nr:thioredoxin domain-containing protein [Candidatus Woesearchaeota archaeon]
MLNNLKDQKSLYLQQHENNPVNWYPYSEKPFELAKEQNKPLLLSIGYSSCHWCHVMAHESYKDKEVAKVLNDKFISIKIDKEEYPDIDSFYMQYLTNTQGHGGWPLNVFVNSSKYPFYALTYLPKPEFIRVLNLISENYSKNKELQNKKIEVPFKINYINEIEAKKLLNSVTQIQEGSLGPRFPQAMACLYLLNKNQNIKLELENLITKGLFDHIEGGFFRYTTDPEWKIPHFEKMLYDQATLLLLCAESHKKHKSPICEYAIRKTVSWLENNMKLKSGLYGSATSADTKDGEGYYYTLEKTKDPEIIKLFRLYDAGLYESRYVPWLDFEYHQNNKEQAEKIINKYKKQRNELNKPELDTKSIMSWNCFLAYSLLKCSQALKDKRIEKLGKDLFKNITKHHITNKLHHVVYNKKPLETQEYLEDYSSYLLFASEIKQNSEGIIKEIKTKFIQESHLYHTTMKIFDNSYLWHDSPFPSGGSMLLNALIDLNSKETERVVSITSGILKTAHLNQTFFSFWLYGFNRYFS